MTSLAYALRSGMYRRTVERNARYVAQIWFVYLSGCVEPVFYLLSIGVGVGALVGTISVDGHAWSYSTFVAPALMATAAMNGTMAEVTHNLYFRFRVSRMYDSVVSSPMSATDVALGELVSAMLRGSLYSLAFLALMWPMGYLHSWWAFLAWPMVTLVGYGFAGIGMAATAHVRTWQGVEYLQLTTLPLMLFSATYFPLERYPDGLQWLVRATPLYQGVAATRELTFGQPSWHLVLAAAYLFAIGTLGLKVAARRFTSVLAA
jgi:lipooligosaccharide transport system permease protein